MNGANLYDGEFNDLKTGVTAAVKSNADLRGAGLHGADLRGAGLHGADLRGATGIHLGEGEKAVE